MGFFNKLKDILFEDVDDNENTSKEPVKEEVPAVEVPKPIAEKVEPVKMVEEEREVPRVEHPIPKVEEVKKEQDDFDDLNERDLFKSENSFPFLDFDEEEFDESVSRVQRPRVTANVLEYEKKKKVEKKYDLGKFERIEKTETVEKKKFKPSPIISPVYGILNEDYKIEDIKDKTDYTNDSKIDLDIVRKKAFGDIDALEEQIKDEPDETYYEETVTVKLKEPEEEKASKVKTIDELLEDTSDVKIEVEDEEEPIVSRREEPAIEIEEEPIEAYNNVEDDLEEIPVEENHQKTEEEQIEDSDTLENDLFDLIDSMYDNREDGEI